MNVLKKVWQSVKFLFHAITGIGIQPELFSPQGEAVAAVFLPLFGLVIGLAGVLAASIAQAAVGLYNLSALAGVAVFAALGGSRQANAMIGLSGRKSLIGGIILTVAAALYFQIYAINELASISGIDGMPAVLLFLPTVGALAMISAACTMPEPQHGRLILSGVKGMHLVLSAVLAFVVMVPRFGMLSMAIVAAALLAGSLAALAAGRKEYKADVLYLAAFVSELLYLLILLWTIKPIIYY